MEWLLCSSSRFAICLRFAMLLNEDYCSKVMIQIERGTFITLSSDINKYFGKKKEDFIKKWENSKVLDKKWAKAIKPSNSKPGTIYKMNAWLRLLKKIIQVESFQMDAELFCGRAFEFLSIFVESYLYNEVNKIDSRIKNIPVMLNIIDNISKRNIITKDSVLVSFHIVSGSFWNSTQQRIRFSTCRVHSGYPQTLPRMH